MLPEYFVTFLLSATMATLPCYGFIAERSVNTPITWNTASSVKTAQGATIDHTASEKTQVAGVDKFLQTFDTKKLTKATEQPSSEDAKHEKRLNFTWEHVETVPHFKKTTEDVGIDQMKQNTVIDTTAPGPRNVVLLLIEMDQDRESFWKDFKASYSFLTEGFLQSCHHNEMDAGRFSLDDAFISGSKQKECDCDRSLRSNIAALLFWARDVKGMTTGIVSNTHFMIPSLSVYEEPISIVRELDDTDKGIMKSKIHDDWHLPDAGRSVNHGSLAFTSNTREDEDTAWNVFEMFSRIRNALFRSLVESFGGIGIPDEPIPSRRSHIVSSNLANIISEFNAVQDEKGFILVAVTSANEVNSAMKLLQHQVSQDTLLAVTEVCSHDSKAIPFLAQGPAANMLQEASTIWDLPTVIRSVIVNGCQSADCRIHVHEALPLPVPPLNIVPKNIVTLRRLSRETMQKSGNGTGETNTSLSKDQKAKKVEDLNANKKVVVREDEEKTAKLKTERSTADVNKVEFAVTFGTIASVVVAFIFGS